MSVSWGERKLGVSMRVLCGGGVRVCSVWCNVCEHPRHTDARRLMTAEIMHRGTVEVGTYLRFEVLRQLLAAGIAGVHRNKVADGLVEVNNLAVGELEGLHIHLAGGQDRADLLGGDGEHLQVDAVELVEARPEARCEARDARVHRGVVRRE